MNPTRRPTRRGSWRRFALMAALALGPKCVLCALAYLGVGAAALGGVEMCGAAADDGGRDLHAWIPWLLAAGALAGGVAWKLICPANPSSR